ncbi:MAG: ParB N-terminal domain-containing protein [Planctomycetota bacterium]|nr:ParB N-terminal domain-containing protein [Planctomycetota bacterium]
MNREQDNVQWIPIDKITVPNPRTRGKKKFKQIIANIAEIGLKKPITVAEYRSVDGETRYLLGCGQGRLEAYQSLGETEIPAIVIEATKVELMLISLIENLARRQPTTMEHARKIADMKDRGDSPADIARKAGLDVSYVNGILKLLTKGEERLLRAVEKEQMPLSVAITIASSNDAAVQHALADAYEKKQLRGKALLRVRRLVEERRSRGKALHRGVPCRGSGEVSSEQLLKVYREETARQTAVVQKAKHCETKLVFAVSALKQLFQDDNFTTLLRAESLNSLPQYLAAQIHGEAC